MKEELEQMYSDAIYNDIAPNVFIEQLIDKIANSVEDDSGLFDRFATTADQVESMFNVGGLAGGLYEDFARHCFKRHLKVTIKK